VSKRASDVERPARRRTPSKRPPARRTTRRRRPDIAGVVVGVGLALVAGGAAELSDGSGSTAVAGAAALSDSEAPPAEVASAVDGLLGQLEIAPEPPRTGFDREDEFPHWSRVPGTSCNTRQRVLVVERREGTPDGCRVTGGRWFSVYDGVSVDVPRNLDVDHMVALAEAWDSGAHAWDVERRERYANDLGYADSLIAVTATSNRQKSDRDPADWQPSRLRVWCRYATAWTTVKIRWGLTADEAEVEALRGMFNQCDRPPRTEVMRAD
jgi:hypothetical protein